MAEALAAVLAAAGLDAAVLAAAAGLAEALAAAAGLEAATLAAGFTEAAGVALGVVLPPQAASSVIATAPVPRIEISRRCKVSSTTLIKPPEWVIYRRRLYAQMHEPASLCEGKLAAL